MKIPAKILAALTILPLAAVGLTGCGDKTETTCTKLGELAQSKSNDEAANKKKFEDIAAKAKDKDLKKALEDLANIDSSNMDLSKAADALKAIDAIDGKCPNLKLKDQMNLSS